MKNHLLKSIVQKGIYMEDSQDTESTLKMLAEYMEGGFLDNIIAMFRHDKSYYPYIGVLLGDERMGVRIGTFALVETLMSEDEVNVLLAIPGIAKLLQDPHATIRGDAAHLLGVIGHKDALPYLTAAANDEHDLVRENVEEAIKEINEGDDER